MRLLMGIHNALTVGVNSHGLYLAVSMPFRVGNPPLLVSWGDVSMRGSKFLFWKYFEFRFRQAPYVFLALCVVSRQNARGGGRFLAGGSGRDRAFLRLLESQYRFDIATLRHASHTFS
jgi:hypothetical protein